jgi:CRP-like cAMP-binding protein
LFRDLGPEQIDWIAAHKQNLELKEDQILFQQGEAVKGLFCVADGLLKVQQRDERGKVRFVRHVLPGGTVGHRSLFIQTQYKGTSQVVSKESHVCLLPTEDVSTLLAQNPDFARNLIVKISSELERSEEEKLAIKERTVRGRLATALLNLCDSYSDALENGEYVLKAEIPKIDLARLLSVADETVIRLMSEMRDEGVISYQDRRILIKKRDKLAELARL